MQFNKHIDYFKKEVQVNKASYNCAQYKTQVAQRILNINFTIKIATKILTNIKVYRIFIAVLVDNYSPSIAIAIYSWALK